MMKKILYTLSIVLFSFSSAMAHQLTPEEALGRLKNGVSRSKSFGGLTNNLSNFQLTYSSSKDGMNTYYVFNNPSQEGFVVLSADDCMPAVLMQSDRGTLVIDKIPENMKWWLSLYDEAVSDYARKGITYAISTSEERHDIKPLLGNIEWGQHWPYNNLCPTTPKGTHAVAGCVATAMAQIMMYWNYPEHGIGYKEYSYNFEYVTDSCTTLIPSVASSDFSNHTYNWFKMHDYCVFDPELVPGINDYDEEEQLVYDCGVAASMEYGNTGSGAWPIIALGGMVDYFGYDASASFYYRGMFSDDQWTALVYNELANDRPVLYSGYTTDNSSGHSFVCDGYRAADNRVHINWGWDGDFNCYCLLIPSGTEDALQVPDYESYSRTQHICANIKPDEGGKINRDNIIAAFNGIYTKGYNANTGEYERTDSFNYANEFIQVYGGFYNLCHHPQSFLYGIKAEGENGTFYLQRWNGGAATIKRNSTFYTVYLRDIPYAGTYTITPIYKDLTLGDTEWKEIPLGYGKEKPTITIYGDNPDYFYLPEKPVISSNGIKTPDNQVLYSDDDYNSSGLNFRVDFKLTSLRDISADDEHDILLYVYGPDTISTNAIFGWHKAQPLGDIDINTTQDFKFTISYKTPKISPGHTYYLRILNSYLDHNTSTSRTKYTLHNCIYQTIPIKVVDHITLPEDVNSDGLIDIADINEILSVMFDSREQADKADVNNDGVVDIADVNAVLTFMFSNEY